MDTGSTAAIRAAIAREDFAGAQRLWDEYAGELQQAVLDGVATAPQMAEARELFEWARLAIAALRAHAADRLGCLHAAQIYEASIKSSSPFLQVRF